MGCFQAKVEHYKDQLKHNKNKKISPPAMEQKSDSKINQKKSMNEQYFAKTQQEVVIKQYDPYCKEKQFNVMVGDVFFSVINPLEEANDIIEDNQIPFDHVIED